MVKIAATANTMQKEGKVRLGGESPSFGSMMGDERDKDGIPNDNGGLAGKLPRR